MKNFIENVVTYRRAPFTDSMCTFIKHFLSQVCEGISVPVIFWLFIRTWCYQYYYMKNEKHKELF